MRMSRSPGKERIIIVSLDGLDKRRVNPRTKPKNTPMIVNVRRRLSRSDSPNFEQHYTMKLIESMWRIFTEYITRFNADEFSLILAGGDRCSSLSMETVCSCFSSIVQLIERKKFNCHMVWKSDWRRAKNEEEEKNLLLTFLFRSMKWKNDSRNGKLCAYMVSDSIRPLVRFRFFFVWDSCPFYFQLSINTHVITMRKESANEKKKEKRKREREKKRRHEKEEEEEKERERITFALLLASVNSSSEIACLLLSFSNSSFMNNERSDRL